MILLATDRAGLEALRAGDPGSEAVAFAVTPELLATHGYGPTETEDAEYAALVYAGIASLRHGPQRWVAVLDGLSPAPAAGRIAEAAYGRVAAPALRWAAVTALFTDEPEAQTALIGLHPDLAGRTLHDVLADEAVLAAVQEHDLLWYAPEELDRIA